MLSKILLNSLFLFGRSYGQSCDTDCNVSVEDQDEGIADCCDSYFGGDYTTTCNCEAETTTTQLVVNAWDDCELDWAVDWVGKSGQFKLYPCADENFFIKINLKLLQAYDNDGKKQNSNKVTSFSFASSEDVSYSYSGDGTNVYELSTDDGSPADALGGVRLNYDFDVDGTTVDFNMTLYLIDADYELTTTDANGTQHTYTLEQGTLKFDFDIENWPFENEDDHLDLEIKITTGGNAGDPDDDGTNGDGESSFSWGASDDGEGNADSSFSIHNPSVYSKTSDQSTAATTQAPDNSGTASVTYDVNSSGKQVDLTFRFESVGLNKNIYYDPWITGNSGDLSGNSGDESSATKFGTIIFGLVCTFMYLIFGQ